MRISSRRLASLVAFASLTLFDGALRADDDPDLPPGAAVAPADYLLRRAEHVGLLRGLPDAAKLPYSPRALAIRQLEKQLAAQPLANLSTWTPIGPAPIPNGQTTSVSVPVSGRVTAIAVHPTNPNIVYVGTAQGGVYRTTDGGTSWTPLMDAALSLSIGSVTIDPTDPTNVLVGTGEGNLSIDSFFGVGLYIIKNADSASPLLTGPFNQSGAAVDVFTNRSIAKILVSPTDHNVVFLATTSGVGGVAGDVGPVLPARNLYRSTNAFSASPTFASLGVVAANVNTIVTSALFDPNDPNILLCSIYGFVSGQGGIYRTTNALAVTPTFTKVFSHSNSVNVRLDAIKVGSAVTILSASGEAVAGCTAGSAGTLRRSTDEGVTWSATLTSANGFCGGQCYYDLPVAADPTNANNILLGGAGNSSSANPCRSSVLLRSTDGGATFVRSDTGLHADEHAITFSPSNPSIVYTGNDGGIFKSTDGGASWTSLNNATFNATQFQSLAVHPSDPFFTIGGTQDNGTEMLSPAAAWTRADFGDGGFALIDQNAADTTNVTMYHTYFNTMNTQIGFARVSTVANATDGGWTFLGCGGTVNGIGCNETVLFYAPMALGPGSPNRLYFGTDRLYRSIDGGTSMSAVSPGPIVSGVAVSAIGISRQTDNVRILGLTNSQLFATTTGSGNVIDVTGATMPIKYVARAVIDPNDSNTAYVTFDGYGVPSGQHVWKNTNLAGGAANWVAAGSGIPDVPVNAFAIDPNDSTHLFAGTDIGVYYSSNTGTSWAPLGSGLPRVAVFDMAFVNSATPANRVLRIATHGRGMWEITPPLPLAVSTPTGGGTFCPGDPVTLSVTASGGAGGYTYQWRKGMVALMDGGSIGGSQTATLAINPSATGDTGSYDCVVTDAVMKSVTSGAASVTVTDPNAPTVTPPAGATVTQTLCQ